MLKIRPQHVTALAAQQADGFTRRMMIHLREIFSEEVAALDDAALKAFVENNDSWDQANVDNLVSAGHRLPARGSPPGVDLFGALTQFAPGIFISEATLPHIGADLIVKHVKLHFSATTAAGASVWVDAPVTIK